MAIGTAGKVAIVGGVLIVGYFVVTKVATLGMSYPGPATSANPGGVGGGSSTTDKVRSWIGVGADATNLFQDLNTTFGWVGGSGEGALNPNSLKP
jgi:hypothetical protein